MEQFEYARLCFAGYKHEWHFSVEGHAQTIFGARSDFIKVCNRYGKEGWEVVSVNENNDDFFMKRRINNKD